MFDVQAWWARDVMMDRIEVPNTIAMQADIDDRQKREAAGSDDYDAIWYQGDYVRKLIAETDYPSLDLEGASQAFKAWKGHKIPTS